jgi:hypothetical protein
MKNRKQEKILEKILFEVYEKGVKQQDCNLTEYIEKVEQALRIHDVVGRIEQLCGFFEADTKTSSATKCKCGREKWEHPKAT